MCAVPLHVWREPVGDQRMELDACSNCRLLWFDRGEIELLIALARPGEGGGPSQAHFRPLHAVDLGPNLLEVGELSGDLVDLLLEVFNIVDR